MQVLLATSPIVNFQLLDIFQIEKLDGEARWKIYTILILYSLITVTKNIAQNTQHFGF